ncbi:MAG: hypothetical protein EPN89_10320 [Methylovulum sp.]|nr:MAG: hypothetical protein EPN89_10320 [Methylovulum sp.]
MTDLLGAAILAKAQPPPNKTDRFAPMCSERQTQRWQDFTTGARRGQLEKLVTTCKQPRPKKQKRQGQKPTMPPLIQGKTQSH